MLFEDRFEAGRLLASHLREFDKRDDVVVLALPRGGVPVGYEVAQALHAPLDVFVVRKLGVKSPAQIVVAVPVASASTCAEFETEVDRVICAATPEPFLAVGQWYQDFSHTTDEEVRELLRRSSERSPAKAA